MKQIIVFSALAVSVISTAFSMEKKPVLVSKQSTVASIVNDFGFLRAHRQGKGITLTWGMTSNSNLIGFDIEKTMEDPNDVYSVWTTVTSISGADARSFKYTDNSVLPGTTNYRLTAWYSDGRSSTSEIIAVKLMAK